MAGNVHLNDINDISVGTSTNPLYVTSASGLPPTGAAGGDLGGTYPNPTVVSVADVTTGVLKPANGGSGVANTGNLTWNAAQTLSFTSGQTMTFPAATTTLAGLGTAQTFSAANTFSAAGATSTPGLSVTGAPFTAGNATTNKPQLMVETTGATSTAWSTSGTMLGVNAPSGFSGLLIDAQVNGASRFSVGSVGQITSGSNILAGAGTLIGWTGSTSFRDTGGNGGINITNSANGQGVILTSVSGSFSTLQLGVNAAAPVAQNFQASNVTAGTSNTAGQPFTIKGSLSTGSGASGDIIFQTGGTGAGATALNTATTALTIKGATQAVVVASGKTFQLGNAATTGLTAGVLAATTNASIVITDSTGQAYRIPCII